MADVENQTAVATPQSAKKEKKVVKKAKNPKAKPSHPPTSAMVNNAIKGLKERGGSSLQAIKKYIAANYKVDAEKVAPFIKKYLKGAVVSGSLVQTKGKGASGSFKLATAAGAGGKPVAGAKGKKSVAGAKGKKSAVKRAAPAGDKVAKKPASPKAKKVVKKSASKAKGAAVKKTGVKAAAKPKSPSKAKKSKTGPAKKPKTPKPKTVKAVPAAKAKKAASPKKKTK